MQPPLLLHVGPVISFYPVLYPIVRELQDILLFQGWMLYTDVPAHQAMHLAHVHPAAGKVHSRVGRLNRYKMKQAVLMELKMA